MRDTLDPNTVASSHLTTATDLTEYAYIRIANVISNSYRYRTDEPGKV